MCRTNSTQTYAFSGVASKLPVVFDKIDKGLAKAIFLSLHENMAVNDAFLKGNFDVWSYCLDAAASVSCIVTFFLSRSHFNR